MALRNNVYGTYREGDFIKSVLPYRDGKYASLSEIYPGSTVSSYYLPTPEEYFDREDKRAMYFFSRLLPRRKPPTTLSSIDDYIQKVRNEEGREGDVVVFPTGFRIKVKSEWYVNLHRLKEEVGRDRFIAMRALDNTLDDAIALLSEADRNNILEVAKTFLSGYSRKLENIQDLCREVSEWLQEIDTENPKKTTALEYVPKLKNKVDAKYIYAHLDGRDVGQVFDVDVRKKLQKESRYEELCKWFEDIT